MQYKPAAKLRHGRPFELRTQQLSIQFHTEPGQSWEAIGFLLTVHFGQGAKSEAAH
jgi:hypothetical protein